MSSSSSFFGFTGPLAVPLTAGELSPKPGPSRVNDVVIHDISLSMSHESVDVNTVSYRGYYH